MTRTVWTPLQVCASTIRSTHLILVQLSLGAVVAHPMHQLLTAEGSSVGMNAICIIALIVPFKQQLMLCCFKCGVCVFPSDSFALAARTSPVVNHTLCNLSLPLMAADRALPLSPEVTACKHLLRCLGILVLIPELDLSRCFGSKRAVLAQSPPFTVWASAAYCAQGNTCRPDMRVSGWTVEA